MWADARAVLPVHAFEAAQAQFERAAVGAGLGGVGRLHAGLQRRPRLFVLADRDVGVGDVLAALGHRIVLARRDQALDLRRVGGEQLGELGRLDAVARPRPRGPGAAPAGSCARPECMNGSSNSDSSPSASSECPHRLLEVAERVVRAAAVDPEQAAVARALHERQLAPWRVPAVPARRPRRPCARRPRPAPPGCATAACPAPACRRRGSRRSPLPSRGRR